MLKVINNIQFNATVPQASFTFVSCTVFLSWSYFAEKSNIKDIVSFRLLAKELRCIKYHDNVVKMLQADVDVGECIFCFRALNIMSIVMHILLFQKRMHISKSSHHWRRLVAGIVKVSIVNGLQVYIHFI